MYRSVGSRRQTGAFGRSFTFNKLFGKDKGFTCVPGPYQRQAISSQLPEALERQK